MSSRSVYRMCAQVASSGEYLRGHGRVRLTLLLCAVCGSICLLLGLVILACVPVCAVQLVVVAFCQLLIKDYYYFYYYYYF